MIESTPFNVLFFPIRVVDKMEKVLIRVCFGLSRGGHSNASGFGNWKRVVFVMCCRFYMKYVKYLIRAECQYIVRYAITPRRCMCRGRSLQVKTIGQDADVARTRAYT